MDRAASRRSSGDGHTAHERRDRRVLNLARGIGDPAFAIAERVGPAGSVKLGDGPLVAGGTDPA